MSAMARSDSPSHTSGIIWMDVLRGVSITAIILHHWTHYWQREGDPAWGASLVGFMSLSTGTFIHLFFFLSGFGLTYSFLKNKPSWSEWALRRLERIVLPYWMFVLLTFMLSVLMERVVATGEPTWKTLVAYLTFGRNFYEPGLALNPALWFMPVLIGFYLIFPFLIHILKRQGPGVLFLFSFLITYSSIFLFHHADYPMEHQNGIFLFYLIEFSFGMIMGYKFFCKPRYLEKFVRIKTFILGFTFYFLSWALIRTWFSAPVYNDLLTLGGLFLMTLPACYYITRSFPRLVSLLREFSRESYTMYLIHVPIIFSSSFQPWKI